MNVTYIIPIKKHLAKFLRPKYHTSWNYIIYKHILRQIADIGFDGYKFRGEVLIDQFLDKELFRYAKPNEYPIDLKIDFPTNKYSYLKFYLSTLNNRRKEDIKTKKINKSLHIKRINAVLHNSFWNEAIIEVLDCGESTIDNAITKFYKKYNLSNSDYRKSSFKRMLYKKNNFST